MRVEVETKTGRRTTMPEKVAKHLQARGVVSIVGAAPTYQTRDMTAARPVVVAPPVDDAVELDTEGVAWSPLLHTQSKTRNTDGTWRKKPGTRPAEST